MDRRITELIRAFDSFDGSYKRDEVAEAITLKEEITPHLLRILADVVQDPAAYIHEDHYANVYAVVLLAHFKEPAAHLPIIRAFCLSRKERLDLWGDMVTATLPALLYQTCNGSFDAIKELACNREAPSTVRGAALESLTYAVAFGVLSREEVIDYFLGLFSGSEDAPDSNFWNNIVTLICDIHPEGAMETIRRAYEEKLVFPGYVGLNEVEQELQRDKEEVLANFRVHVERSVPEDVHDYCSWFSCFREMGHGEEKLLPPADMFPPTTAPAKGRKAAKKPKTRHKNKIARKSRKKNKQ